MLPKAEPVTTAEVTAPVARLQIRHVLVIVWLPALATFVSGAIGDNSFLWHVRAGSVQASLGEVLRTDPFSYSMSGASWRTQSWIAELGYAHLERFWAGGLEWVPWMVFFTAAATLGLVGLAMFRESRSTLATTLWLLVMVWLGAAFFPPRPVLFSLLFLALLVVVLQWWRQLLWIVPPLIWLWAGFHGSFLIGIGLVVLMALRLRSRRVALAAGLSVVGASATAHGLAIWSVILAFFSNRGALEFIQEWLPPDFTHPVFVAYLVLIGGVLVAAVTGRIDRRDLIVIIPFLIFGLTSRRALYPAAIVLAPYAARSTMFSLRTRASSPVVPWAVVLGLVAISATIIAVRPVDLRPDRFPSKEVMATIGPGEFFHDVAVGGWLIFAEYPQRQVYFDDRAELYGEEFFREFGEARRGLAWEEVFNRYGMGQALARPDWPLTAVLAAAGWEEAFRDENFVVLRAP